MTLDEKLKELRQNEISGSDGALTFRHSNSPEVLKLLAALQRCREQRNTYHEAGVAGQIIIGNSLLEHDDAEILKILEGK